MTWSIFRQQRKQRRDDPWITRRLLVLHSALNSGNSGQTSYGLCFLLSPIGPSQPSAC